jgi:hypothetical protein
MEASIETTRKTETTQTTQDELTDAVKQDDQQNTKFGVTANSSQNWVWGSANESASFDLGTTQQTARENTHKQMRQQTQTLSEEIKTNYKSTFKTVSEVTDMSSKRYVLANSTGNLINYELRRKMRQVCVQVQDVGTYLCWQTYVDDAGRSLGVANLVSIAKPPDLPADPNPQAIPSPMPIKGDPITRNYTWPYDNHTYPSTTGAVQVERIKLYPPQSGYIYDSSELIVNPNKWGWVVLDTPHKYATAGWKIGDTRNWAATDADVQKTVNNEDDVKSVVVAITINGSLRDDSHPSFTGRPPWEVPRYQPFATN